MFPGTFLAFPFSKIRAPGVKALNAFRVFTQPSIFSRPVVCERHIGNVSYSKSKKNAGDSVKSKNTKNNQFGHGLDFLLENQEEINFSNLEPLIQSTTDVEELFEKSQNFINSGKWDQAIEVGKQILSQHSGHHPSQLVLGFAYFHKAQYREALGCFSKFLENVPTHVGALYYSAKCCFFLDELVDFSSHLNSILKLDNRHVQANFLKGIEYYSREQYQQAIHYFRKVSFIDIHNYTSLVYLGLCYASLGDYSSSNQAFQSVIDIKQDEKAALFGLAENFTNQRLYFKALVNIEKLIAIGKTDFSVYTLLYNIKKNLGEFSECHKILDELVLKFPNKIEVLLLRCDLLVSENQIKEALQFIDQRIIPIIQVSNEPEQLYIKQMVLEQKMNYLQILQADESVIDSLKKEIVHMQNTIYETYINWIEEAENQGKFQNALDLVFKAEKYGVILQAIKGYLLHQLGQYEHAIEILNRAIEAQEINVFHAKLILSDCYSDLKNFQLAMENIEEAIKLEEGFCRGLIKKSILLVKFGHYESALTIIDEVLKTEKDNFALRELRDDVCSRIENARLEKLMNSSSNASSCRQAVGDTDLK